MPHVLHVIMYIRFELWPFTLFMLVLTIVTMRFNFASLINYGAISALIRSLTGVACYICQDVRCGFC